MSDIVNRMISWCMDHGKYRKALLFDIKSKMLDVFERVITATNDQDSYRSGPTAESFSTLWLQGHGSRELDKGKTIFKNLNYFNKYIYFQSE